MASDSSAARSDLSQLLGQIDEASQHTRGAVGSATQYLKTVQSHLRDRIGDVVEAHTGLECPGYDNDYGFDPFRILEWDGKSLVLCSGIAGDPDSYSTKPILEASGPVRIEAAKALPKLIEAILNKSKELADSLGVLADESRVSPPPPPPPPKNRKLPPPPPAPSKSQGGDA